APPASWSADGDSSTISAAKTTEHTGCSVSRIEVTTAGRRGSEIEISSQPTICEENASRISQPVADNEGVRSRSPMPAPIAEQKTADASVAVKRGPAGRLRSRLP